MIQQQRPAPTRGRYHPLEVVILVLDLLIGLSLGYALLRQLPHLPRDTFLLFHFSLQVAITIGVLAASLFLARRQRSLAQAFQGLAALGGLGIALIVIVTIFWPRSVDDILIYVRALWRECVALFLILILPFALRDIRASTDESH
jgi:hypothetical protein